MPQRRVRPHVNPLSIIHDHVFDGFKNNKPIFIDIGAYKGEFTLELLKKFPDHNFLVFEIRKPIYLKLCEMFAKYDNVMVFDGDAGRNFQSILQPCIDQGSFIKEVYINFPDPWPKERHKKRRFITTKFLKNIANWIQSETYFVFQTDQKLLFQDTLEILEECDLFLVEFFDTSPYGVQTHWETIKMNDGEPIYRLRFKKKQ